MKQLQVTIMVLILCTIGVSVARSELVAGYTFDGCLFDCSDNGYEGELCYSPAYLYSSDVPPGGSGGKSLCLDGDNCVVIPVDGCVFEGDTDFSIVFWFKTTQESGVFVSASSEDCTTDEHCMSVVMLPDGDIYYDNWWTSAAGTNTTGLNDDVWHHYAVVHSAPATQTLYIDGIEDGSGSVPVNLVCSGTTVVIGDVLCTALKNEWNGNGLGYPYNGFLDDLAIYNHALNETEVVEVMNYAPCETVSCPCPWICALDIDPNVMTVFEAGETIGDFDVSLWCEPTGVVTVTVDPNNGNGPNDDLTLIGGSGPQNRITLSFDPDNFYVPQTVTFRAIDDNLEEWLDVDERHYIRLTTACADPNWDGKTKDLSVTVQDNDCADILFTYTLPERSDPYANVTGPVQIWEEPRWFFGIPMDRWRKIGITLQVPPLVDGDPCQPTSVKLQAAVEGDNPPLTDPTLPFAETDDPNGLIFTAANYNVTQSIKAWGNDDNMLQAIDATSEGDQNYQANLVFTVIDDGGDERYTGMQRTVQFNIEDNECGAYGILPLDVGNPYAFTDPNFLDENGNPLPDCRVDVYDLVEIAVNWLRCTNPQDENCVPML